MIIIVTALALGGYLAFSKRLCDSKNWKVTVTPLASINLRVKPVINLRNKRPEHDLIVTEF
jgi:hypothetical protein